MSIYHLGDGTEYHVRQRTLYHDSGIPVAEYHHASHLTTGEPALTLYIAAQFSTEDKQRIAFELIERAADEKTIRSAHVECACGTCADIAVARVGERALCLLCKGAQCQPDGHCRRRTAFADETAQ